MVLVPNAHSQLILGFSNIYVCGHIMYVHLNEIMNTVWSSQSSRHHNEQSTVQFEQQGAIHVFLSHHRHHHHHHHHHLRRHLHLCHFPQTDHLR